MRLKNKRGIELAVNFFVIMIISLVILGMGIYLVSLFFKTTEELKTNLDEQTSKEIQKILFEGKRVAIPLSNTELKRGKGHTFGLGILNILGETKNFKVHIGDGPIIKSDNTQINEDQNGYTPLEHIQDNIKEIQNNEQEITGVPVRVPRSAQLGTYVLNVYVCNCTTTQICTSLPCDTAEQTYDNSVHKIYVKVT